MKNLVILILSLKAVSLCAQSVDRKNIDIQSIIDELISYQDQDLNYEELYENYLDLLNHPLDINNASAEQLRNLFILNELQINSLLQYRNENGALISEYELQSIPNFDLQSIQKLLPFILIRNPEEQINDKLLKRIRYNPNNYLVFRSEFGLENKAGFTEEDSLRRFLGHPQKYYLRYRNSIANDFSIGVTAEQDAGEAFTWSPGNEQFIFDYLSFHAQLQNKGRLKNLIVGDYQLQSGQGLVLGGAFGTGKGGETINTIRRSNILAIPFTSALENFYLRGFTLTYQVAPKIRMTPFLSITKRDANQTSDSLENNLVTALLSTGFHRNYNELSDRKQLNENRFGFTSEYVNGALQTGIIYQHTHFSNKIVPNENLYNQFNFRGKVNQSLSAFLNYSLYNFAFFSEVAYQNPNTFAFVAGTLGSLSPTFDIALLIRNYQRGFHSLSANAFSENSQPKNERGIYWGTKYKIHKHWLASAYIDLFQFPWLQFRNYSPSSGYEWLMRIQYQPAKNFAYSLQIREESKQRNSSIESPFYLTAQGVKRSLFLNADYGVATRLSMRSRIQFSQYTFNSSTTQGMALVQDIAYDFGNLKVSARYALFDTEDYDNRQYAGEKDMWLAYSFQAYAGEGLRRYILLQYDINKKLSLWVRYAHVRINQVESMGSGLDEIEGNERNDIKCQVRIKF
ncbi:MAG: helix-hairpin-helix domain-containing protein [Cytophagia bacterium]|nr:helix-hairpin-helix domain-containing protein [Cytophagia bacterium]NBW38004.1 helix-hairpin-helix domain-containing protein [Cytophagia bacterium]